MTDLKEQTISLIDNFLSDEAVESIKLPKVPISWVTTHLSDLGYDYDASNNSWTYDFFITFYSNGKDNFELSGDAWYEEFHTLTRLS